MRSNRLLLALSAWAGFACGGERSPVGEAMAPPIGASTALLQQASTPDAAPAMPAMPADIGPDSAAPGHPRVLQLTLRSTPSGAVAIVDGHRVGTTPARADLPDDKRQHDFRFTLPGHEEWRLRFAPSRDGVIHATMRPASGPDAGVR